MANHKLKFWGVRGSSPTPDEDKRLFGGETSCLEIRTSNNELIIFDMGTGLRNLGNNIIGDPNSPKSAHIFISHFHWDHVMGFLSFKPFFDSRFSFSINGKGSHNNSMHEVFSNILDQRFWPVSLDMLSANISFNELHIGKKKILPNVTVHTNLHPHPNGAFSYRVQIGKTSIVYVTDIEHPQHGISQNVVELAKNADVLIHDSHFTPEDLPSHKGWGHSSWKEAVAVAKEANVKQLVLFHHNPDYDDAKLTSIENEVDELFRNLLVAREGMTIELPSV